MERMLTQEERIKKAEEIYNRRRSQNTGIRVDSNSVNNGTKPQVSLFKKMILQILICLLIYFIFYLIQNTNYIFSEDVLNKTNEILSYDMNIEKIYDDVVSYINNILLKQEEGENGDSNEGEEKDVNAIEGESVEPNPITEENIGGTVDEDGITIEGPEVVEDNSNLSQMEIDAKDIKSKYFLIKPLEGVITSRYGLRNPTTSSVPKNHTGIDIAANIGTPILASLEGVVSVASSEGDYGKHLKIVKDDITIVYAHCNKLNVKQGDIVKQGDVIAEVGATGNVTGPHLHFEIRKNERYVNPDYILSF